MKTFNRLLMETENDHTHNLGGKKMKAKELILGLVALSVLLFATSASAEVPQMINYEGVLTDTTGCPVDDGEYDMVFRIYNAETGGDSLWGESHNSVDVTQGNFNVSLGGSGNPVPSTLFLDDALWLEVEVEGEKMTPRQRIASVGYAFRSGFADTADHCWTISDGDWTIDGDDIYREDGNVAIGTEDPYFDTKLDVWAEGGTAVKGESEDDSGGKFGGKFYANGAGYSNVGVWARAGCYGFCAPASHCNIGIYAKDGSSGVSDEVPPGNWAGYFEGDVKITDSLDVDGSATIGEDLSVTDDLNVDDDAIINDRLIVAPEGAGVPADPALYVHNSAEIREDLTVGGTLKLTFDYESAWTGISQGGYVTLTHNLGGDSTKYVVFLYGKSTSGYVHQKNYGTNYILGGWRGCEWGMLTSTSIRVWRGDNDASMANDADWKYVKVRILKNQ